MAQTSLKTRDTCIFRVERSSVMSTKSLIAGGIHTKDELVINVHGRVRRHLNLRNFPSNYSYFESPGILRANSGHDESKYEN